MKAYQLLGGNAVQGTYFTIVQDGQGEVTVFRFRAEIDNQPTGGDSLGTWDDIDSLEVRAQLRAKLLS